jgi:hypothetical protein
MQPKSVLRGTGGRSPGRLSVALEVYHAQMGDWPERSHISQQYRAREEGFTRWVTEQFLLTLGQFQRTPIFWPV